VEDEGGLFWQIDTHHERRVEILYAEIPEKKQPTRRRRIKLRYKEAFF